MERRWKTTKAKPFALLKARAVIRGESTLATVSSNALPVVCDRLERLLGMRQLSPVQVHDLDELMAAPGGGTGKACRIYEVCDRETAARLLAVDPGMAHVLPCRISLHDRGGVTTVTTPRPTALMPLLSHSAEVDLLARTIEAALCRLLRGLR